MNKSVSPLLVAAFFAVFIPTDRAFANDAKPTAATGPVAAAPSSDSEMSQALLKKINKGSGDIVIRTGDLPAQKLAVAEKAPVAKPEVKPKVVSKEKEPTPTPIPHDVHWSYADGPGGPENWGNLNKENLACNKGKLQSPININIDNAVKVNLPALEFMYRQSPLAIVDNGYTIMVNYGEGSNLMVDDRQYRLVQFHFHKPSEEAINGERMDMVAHLVHQHHSGAVAIVAVLMTTKPPVIESKYWWGSDTSPPQDNPLIQSLWSNIPLVKNREEYPGVMIDVAQLLPQDKTYFTYMGSLNTPPCTEEVLWFVMKTPITVSEEQVMNFGRIYPMNARPLQPKGDRLVKEAKHIH
jgi:carbonic anhydrase